MILPIDVTNEFLRVLQSRHQEHTDQLARQRGKKAGTYERIDFDVLAEPGKRLRTQKPPIALVGVVVPLDQTVEEDDSVTVIWQVLIEVHVAAQANNRPDLILRRDVYAWTIAECILQRVPRGRDSFIQKIEFADIATGDNADGAADAIAVAVLDFDVTIRDAFSVSGLPPDDSPLPPGSPGGPPIDSTAPAKPWPHVASITDTTTREALDG